MSYLAFYRKYRPKSFDSVIGQGTITKTLINQIESGKVAHAYLFCGSRGTGKTTCAKIFARAINCESPINGSPCGKCGTCVTLAQDANFDITEIDAASNNGVDDAKLLREKVNYPPVKGKYKVYIIDEVHMLSTEAFNALLKTIEEPPAHAVFILATTEAHKLPATILSRCMRFDFKLVSVTEIASLLKNILKENGKSFDDDAILFIAKAGEGSVRDALSVLEACFSTDTGKLSLGTVLNATGLSGGEITEALIESMLKGEVGECLSKVNEIIMSGKSITLLNYEIMNKIRDIFIINTCSDARSILLLPEEKFTALETVSKRCDKFKLMKYLEAFTQLDGTLRYASYPRILFENELIKCCNADKIKIPDAPAAASESGKVCAELLKTVRERQHIALFSALKEAHLALNGNKVVITVSSDMSHKVLNQQMKTLQDILTGFGNYTAEIILKEKAADSVESGIEQLKNVFGDKNITVIE